MTQENKSALWQTLKAAGVEISKPYRQCSEEELEHAVAYLRQEQAKTSMAGVVPAPERGDRGPIDRFAHVPVMPADPNEMAGEMLNTHTELTPIRKDEDGRVWFQNEVRKPAYAKPRGRRVLTVQEHDTKQVTVPSGQFTESFEVPDRDSPLRPTTIKITLPSYQVGIYQDPRFPQFKTICYGGNEGFDFEDVQRFYGGPELVPSDVQRKYVENVLCYDQRTVIRAIEAEYRQSQLNPTNQGALQ